MNVAPLFAAILLVTTLAAAVWAVIERGRAVRAEERARLLEANGETLKAQAAHSAQMVAEALVRRAGETFDAQEKLAQAKLEAQLKPVAETLAKFQLQAAAAEKARVEETGSLKAQIAQMLTASVATQDEARKLSAALRRGAGVQGRWGEQTLRNVLEAAGLAHRFDFEEQFSVDSDEGRRRPDVKVRLPGGAVFVIDAKCSLNAFLDAQDAVDDAARDAALARHAQSIRGHIAGLSAKAYWDQFKAEGSPDFVAMFVPGDSFLAAALDRAPDLMTEAMDRRVLLVTPTTLFALCKAVAYGWRVEEQAKSLEDSVKRYNQFASSLESQVLTQARRFEELKVDHEGRKLPELTQIESGVRELTKLASEMRGERERDDTPILTLKASAPTSAA